MKCRAKQEARVRRCSDLSKLLSHRRVSREHRMGTQASVGWYRAFGKRVFDLLGTGACLIFAIPLMGAIALGVLAVLGRPVLFRHRRAGLGGRPFTLYKFRSMSDARDGLGRLLPDAERLGRFGQFLRKTSLDELPELWNVLRGEMSLVGPRPLLMEYVERYSPEQARRLEVKPGITGWAQINGRNHLSWDERFALDVWYVDNMSFLLDLKILGLTFWKVVRREGISALGHATMEGFKGLGGQGKTR